MKVKNEIKIAAVAILGIVIMFFGMQFLKGLDMFSDDASYQMKFSNISGLSTSSPIYANGYRVGPVKSINYDYQHNKDIAVDVVIDENMSIPNDTKAEIVSDMLGNVQVNLLMGTSRTMLKKGDAIEGIVNGGALGEVKNMIPTVQAMLPKLDSIMGSLNQLLADPSIAASMHNVNRITNDLTVSTRQLNALLYNVNKEFPGLMGKTHTLLNTAGGTMANANMVMATVNGKVGSVDVQKTMAKVDSTLSNIQLLTDKLNSNHGTLGRLMNDESLYTTLHQTMSDADSLVRDLKEHPKRYVHFSIFGRKDKK